MPDQGRAEVHECVFVEEQEPNGRLVLPPCIVCNLSAMDAIEQLRQMVNEGGGGV